MLPQWLSTNQSACNAGDMCLIPVSGRTLEKEMASHSSIPSWESEASTPNPVSGPREQPRCGCQSSAERSPPPVRTAAHLCFLRSSSPRTLEHHPREMPCWFAYLLMCLNWLIGKDPDAGKDWRQEEKGMTEDEMVGWHHRPDGHEFEQAPGVANGQGSLACSSPWGWKESDTTERLSWGEV